MGMGHVGDCFACCISANDRYYAVLSTSGTISDIRVGSIGLENQRYLVEEGVPLGLD